MQKLKNKLAKFFFVVLVTIFSSAHSYSQTLGKAELQDMINSKNFVFTAQSVFPMTGGSRQLTSRYDVRIVGDSVVADLPYFGRAYSATYGEPGGINFTSTKSTYKVKQRKKGGWDISIKPKDGKDVRELNFTISENGYTNLQVNSNNRQPISFSGYLSKQK